MVNLKTTNQVYDSIIVKTQNSYEENIVAKFSGHALDHIKLKFAQNAFELSQQFKSDSIEVIAMSWRFREQQVQQYLNSDLQYIGYVVLTCFLYMIFHLRSLYFSILSLLNIAFSVPISMLIYRHVFEITYFSSLHLSVVIIIIGIGCDDIFVFHDFWKSNFSIPALKHRSIMRLSYVFRKAFKSMFVTSLTSAVMFASCVYSDIMPVRSFGVFAGLTVPLVFI